MFGLVKRVNSRFPNLERPVFIFELNYSGGQNKRAGKFNLTAFVIISSGQRNLMKTYHNDANTSRITKIALKNFLYFF